MFNFWEREEEEEAERDTFPRLGFAPYLNHLDYGTRGRFALEAEFGKVYDTQELIAEFEVRSFFPPFVSVTRREDGVRGSICFQNNPRFYWGFEPYPVTGVQNVSVSVSQPEQQESLQGCHQSGAADNSR